MHDWVAVVVSIIAAIISVISLTRQTRLGHEATTQKLIHDQYQLCRALDLLRVDNLEVSHLLALPAQYGGKPWRNYERFKNYVCQLFSDNGSITEASRARIYLQEHATALHVYVTSSARSHLAATSCHTTAGAGRRGEGGRSSLCREWSAPNSLRDRPEPSDRNKRLPRYRGLATAPFWLPTAGIR